MKILFSNLVMGLLLLLFTACQDDDDLTPREKLIGEWEVQSSEVDITIEGQDYVDFIQQADNLSDEEKTQIIEEIQFIIQPLNQTQGSTIDFKANNIYEEEGGDTGTWTLSNDGLTLTMNPDNSARDFVFDVQTLTNVTMTLFLEEEDREVDWDQDGENDTLVAQLTIELTK